MSISTPFIHRPAGTTLLTVAVALAGALGYLFLPVSPLPQVEFPTIQVSSSLPGASPETMASSVATPLERQFGRIAGITEMTSTSFLGSTSITLQFDLNRNIDAAARDVQAAINAAQGQLPTNLPSNPNWRKVNPADAPILILSLTSETYSVARMYDAAASILQQKLAQVQGVGQVTVGGGALPAVRVEVNPTLLNSFGLAMEDVRNLLGSANANRPKGEIADDRQFRALNTTDQLLTAKEYQPLLLAYRNGSPVRLSDVAEVTDSVEDVRTAGLWKGQPAVLLVIFRQPGANIIDTVDRVRALVPQLQAEIPRNMLLSIVLDRTTTIRASVKDVEFTLMLSIGLVILVVFLFLRNWRATLIPSVAVPISLIGTFGVMYLAGYSIDNLSLMAMTIATGFVVDDAIVVIENISRYLEEGLPPMEAALKGAREIGFTVVSISVSLVAVFIPILLMGGIVGRLFREFAVTLSVAIGVSLVVSLTTTPMMCAHMLKHHRPQEQGRLFRFSERVFESILAFYRITLSWVLRHPRLTLMATLSTVVLTVYLYIAVPKGFFPQQDTGRFVGSLIADQDSSFQSLKVNLGKFAEELSKDPSVEGVIAMTGGQRGSANTGLMFGTLKPNDERKLTADQVIARVRAKTAKIPGATLFLQAVQDLRIGGRASSAQYQFTLQSDNFEDLTEWTPKIMESMKKLPGIVDVTSDQQNRGLQASLQIDRTTASRLGISQKTIDDTLYDAFGQRQITQYFSQVNSYHLILEVMPDQLAAVETLNKLYVKSSTGQAVPLSTFVKWTTAPVQPLSISHQSQFPAVTISFNLAAGAALG
ncbi:MAG TPA: efflux RND transporter permease subunit, partial [Planctomycetota bacterium]|nr:efflux RND transporter permease subunit [Planctomycetota bacterium]